MEKKKKPVNLENEKISLQVQSVYLCLYTLYAGESVSVHMYRYTLIKRLIHWTERLDLPQKTTYLE